MTNVDGKQTDKPAAVTSGGNPQDNRVSADTEGEEYGGNVVDVVFAFAVFGIATGLLLKFVVFAGPPEDVSGLILVGVSAAIIGWGIGIVATPYNLAERTRLGDISKVGYAALTGYIVAKIDKVFDSVFVKSFNPVILPYVGIGLTMLLGALIVTYITRSYAWTITATAKQAIVRWRNRLRRQ